MYKFTPTPHTLIIKFKNQFKNERDGIKIDSTYNPEQHIRIHAEVVGVPSRFETTTLAHKYEGKPAPRSYSSKSRMTSLYYKRPTFYTAKDCDIDIRVGDTIYFHYLAIQFEDFGRPSHTYLNRDEDGYEYHQIQVDTLIAVLRDGELIPLLGRCFAQPKIEDEFTINGFKMLKSKKLLHGKLTHVGSPIGGNDADISPGDDIIYLNQSEFENEIEGQYYYVMRHWFVVAKKVGDQYLPVGDYIKMEKLEEDSLFKLEGKSKPIQANGLITEVGERADKDLIGNTVSYNNRASYFAQVDDNTIFVRQEDIIFIKCQTKHNSQIAKEPQQVKSFNG